MCDIVTYYIHTVDCSVISMRATGRGDVTGGGFACDLQVMMSRSLDTNLEDVVAVDHRIEDGENGINARHQRLWRTTAAQFTESDQIAEHYRRLFERLSPPAAAN